MKSLVAIRICVIRGSLPLADSNTATTFGTTYTIRPVTIAKHMTDSTIGYSIAARIFWRICSRPSV